MIGVDELDRERMERLFARADQIRDLAETREGRAELALIGAHVRILNVFAQPSSRTYLSFEAAEAVLGMERMNVRDLSTSSAVKGESLEDTFRTFLTYCDILVLRHPDDTAVFLADRIGREAGVPVVNAGSGTKEHPTQALLDLYTIQRAFGSPAAHSYVLAGDLKRGRTARSLARLLSLYPDVTLTLAAPRALQMNQDVLDELNASNTPWSFADELTVDADVVYLTRVQDEWSGHEGGHPSTDPRFVFRAEHLQALPASSIVMHPLPKRDEVTPAVCDSGDPRLVWWDQVANGLWIRAALLEELILTRGMV